MRAADGTRLAVQTIGDGPALVLANGLGGSITAWHHLIRRFAPRFRIVSWDYRGLYGSDPPTDLEALGIEQHREDLRTVMDAVGVDSAILAGWSMGVQVILDFTLRHPERARALIAINGSPGNTFRTAFDTTASEWLIPVLALLIQLNARQAGAAFRWVTSLEFAPALLKRVGLVGPTVDLDLLRTLAAEFAGLDLDVYMRTMRKLGSHSTWPRLGEIGVPTLVVGGTRDVMTPAHVAEATAAAIPGAELLLLEGGTHYTPLEFPDAINARIERFVAERLACRKEA
ncbi:MAG TPA: alpha/beta hydrolase [Candidatus Binatia bacterium]|nr:alpha/beta hydrolase [Candidatus Binatia bacterium]